MLVMVPRTDRTVGAELCGILLLLVVVVLLLLICVLFLYGFSIKEGNKEKKT